jgi:hypothetical protein
MPRRQRSLEREAGHADDRVHRRADLVAHVREKFALRGRGRFRFLARDFQLMDELREVLCRLFQRLIGLLALSDVAGRRVDDSAIERRRSVPFKPSIRTVAGAIPVFEIDDAGAGCELRHRLDRPAPIVVMNEVKEGRATQLCLGETEHVRPCRVHTKKVAVETGDAQKIGRQIEERVEFIAGPFTRRIHANLAAGDHHGLEQRGVRFANVAAEELHHADDIPPAEHRQRKRGVETYLPGSRRPGKIAVDHDVGNPCGPAKGPDSAGQADPTRERRPPAQLDEFGESLRGIGPRPHESKRSAGSVQFPERAVFPAKRFAHCCNHPWRRGGKCRRLGNGAGDGLHDCRVALDIRRQGERSRLFHSY